MENEEVIVDDTNEAEEKKEEQSNDDFVKVPKTEYEKINQTLGSLKRELKDLKKSKDEPKEEKNSSNEFGYAEKAFLTASGLKGSKEFGLAQQFAKETGKSLEQVLESKYFQNELTDLREIEKTTNATITGKDSTGNSIDSVEYWATKDFKDVPKEMKSKVIDFQLKKEKEKDVFYNSK